MPTPTSTAAGSTSGTPRRRSRWRGPPGCTRRELTARSLRTTKSTPLCPISWSAWPRWPARCSGRSAPRQAPARRPRTPAQPASRPQEPEFPLMAATRSDYLLSQLDVLEAESIHIMREVAAEFERPVLLFSGGKDSIVMLALAERAFAPARIPFPVMHIDTGHNFPEVLEFRDRRTGELGLRLIVASVQESIDAGKVVEESGRWASRNRLQTTTLLDGIAEHRFDAVFGGARRDEEKARAKERIFSFRDEFGQWDPKNQRPELWNLYNGSIHKGEHVRVFPLSNWTELDIWSYVAQEDLELPSIYYAHRRTVFERSGMLMAICEHLPLQPGEEPFEAQVRYRTVGDMTCTAAVESDARTVEDVIAEVASFRVGERGATRVDDKF